VPPGQGVSVGHPGASVRIGFIHYNTAHEIDRLLETLAAVRPS
jgi:selenocysteine lyase/cysteine desulfurase